MSSMTKQVFISYSSKDAVAAEAICEALEQAGVSCWIAPRDLGAGASWGGDIVGAIKAAQAMLVVVSKAANDSPQVARELEVATSNRRPLIPVRIENVSPSEDFQYFLGVSHWTTAFPGPLASYLPKLVQDVKAVLAGEAKSWRSFARRAPKTSASLLIVGVASVAVLGAAAYGMIGRRAPPASGDLTSGADGLTAGAASPLRVVGPTADPCQAKLPKPPKAPVRDIDGVYPGMKVSEARRILLCRYPEASQKVLPFTTTLPSDSSRRNAKRMEFTYPEVEGDHAGGTFSITYDAGPDPIVLQVYHKRFYPPDRGPDPARVIADFAKTYEPGRKLLPGEMMEDAYTVAYDTDGKRVLKADLAAAQDQDPFGRDYRRSVDGLIRCLAVVGTDRFEISDGCGIKIAIRVHPRATGITGTVYTSSTDMALAAETLAKTPFP